MDWDHRRFLLAEGSDWSILGERTERLPEQIVGKPGHRHPAALSFAVKRADHVIGQTRGIQGAWHGFDGSTEEFDKQGEDDGTDEHRQPEVGEDRAAQGDDGDPGETFDVGDGVHGGPEVMLVWVGLGSLEEASENDDDGRTEHRKANDFQAVANGRGVSDGRGSGRGC